MGEEQERNKAIVRRMVDEVQSQHRLEVADEIMDPHIVDHFFEMQGIPEPPDPIEAFKRFYTGILAAFPDVTATIHSMVAEGTLVATYKTLHGTHLGEFRGVPPTGLEADIPIMDVFRIADGRLAEHWGIVDFTRVLRMLKDHEGSPNQAHPRGPQRTST